MAAGESGTRWVSPLQVPWVSLRMMRWLVGAVGWLYDFLAEDLVLLIGTAIAIGVVVLAVHTVRNAAGVILYGVVVAVIATSLWRAAIRRV